MRLAHVLAALSLASALSAQSLPFGTPFALTNTRYQPAGGSTLLRSNGSEAFVFWADSRLRMSRVAKGETRVGRQLFDTRVDDRNDFDAVWTGSHFFVVAMETGTYEIFGRIVSASGEPQGEPFVVTHGLWPRVAFNGKYVLLITTEKAYVLTADGKPSGFEPQEVERRFFSGPAYVVSNGDRFAAILPTGGEQMLAMFDANGQLLSQRRIADGFTRTALASDGSRMLAVTADGPNLSATLIQPDGSFGSAKLLEVAPSVFFFDPEVAWNGTRWVIAYRDSGDTRIAEVDASGQFIVARQTIARAQEPVLVSIGSRVVTAWLGNNGSIFSDELPVRGGAPAAHEANPQQVLATATSANATLVVFRDVTSVRAGIRTRDGRWRERELPPSAAWAVAASDGREFMVIVGDTAIRLDADGQLKPGVTTRITEFFPQDIAWNGSAYAVIGERNGTPIAALLSPAGTLSQAVGLPYSATAPSIASNGDGFFAVWLIPQTCPPLAEFCPPGGMAGIHLDANLLPVDASPTVLEPSSPGGVFGADVTWNGTEYIAAWASTNRGIVAARIGKPEQFVLAKVHGTGVSVAPVPGGAAVGWSLFNLFSNIPHESAVAHSRRSQRDQRRRPDSSRPGVRPTFPRHASRRRARGVVRAGAERRAVLRSNARDDGDRRAGAAAATRRATRDAAQERQRRHDRMDTPAAAGERLSRGVPRRGRRVDGSRTLVRSGGAAVLDDRQRRAARARVQ